MKNSVLMKYILPVALLLIIVIAVILSTKNKEDIQENFSGTHEVLVQEVIQTKSYTYMNVSEGENIYWVALVKQPAEVGDKFYFESALEMVDFPSKELDRIFPLIYFIQESSRNSGGKAGMDVSMPSMIKPSIPFEAESIIEPDKDGISVGQLFGKSKEYSGKKVIIRGKVVKVNNEIMDRNWVHIQDGTQADGNYDITITTLEYVEVGDTLSFQGIVVLDKDFGAGYKYDVIIENAVLKNLP